MAVTGKTLAVYADTKGKASCRGCHAPITWAELVTSGKRMCFTGDPVALRTEYSPDRRLIEHFDFGENHWATCPAATQFKGRPR